MNTYEARIRIQIMLDSPSLENELSELEREALQFALDHWKEFPAYNNQSRPGPVGGLTLIRGGK